MLYNEVTVWSIHGGKTSDPDLLFLKKHYIAIGGSKMGDLGKLPTDREAFKARVAEAYPDMKPRAIPNNEGQTFRVLHETKVGGLVVYRSQRDHQIHIGQVTGLYKYDPSIKEGYPNFHAVKWLKELPRTDFSQGSLYEIGSVMSFFQVRNYAGESRAALEGKSVIVPFDHDPAVVSASRRLEVLHILLPRNL